MCNLDNIGSAIIPRLFSQNENEQNLEVKRITAVRMMARCYRDRPRYLQNWLWLPAPAVNHQPEEGKMLLFNQLASNLFLKVAPGWTIF